MNRDDHDDNPGSEPAHDDRAEPQAPRDAPDIVATTDPAVAAASKPGGPQAPPFDQPMVVQTVPLASPGRPDHDPKPAGPAKGQDRPKGDDGRDHHPAGPAPARPPAWRRNALTAAAALAFGVGGAFAYSRFEASRSGDSSQSGDAEGQAKKGGGSSKKDESSDSTRKDEGGMAGGPGSDQAAFSGPVGGDKFQDQLRHLSERIDQLEQRFASMTMPRDASPPDLSHLRVKVGEMSRAMSDSANLTPRVQQVEARLDRIQDELKAARDRPPADKARPAPAPAPANGVEPAAVASPTAAAPPPRPADELMTDGVALFKKGQYERADVAFSRLQAVSPDDARVWYYSALSHGLATGQWEGDTRRLVQRGADRERMGSPPTQDINDAFNDLTTAHGKDWLASYRTQLLKR